MVKLLWSAIGDSIGSASVRGKKCMRIFCEITRKLIRLKFIVELLVFWQQGVLLSITEIKLFFSSCQPGFCFWDSDVQGLCSLAYMTCFAQGPSLVLFQNGSTLFLSFRCCSVTQYHSLWPRGLQHARLPGPSLSPGDCSNSWLLSQWFHPTISSSVIPFSCLQSFPASGSFPMSQLFASVGQSIGASASASGLPVNIQGWFPLGWTGWISLQSKGLSGVFSSLILS